MHRVAAIQDPLDPLRVQPRTPDDPVQPVPDPGRPVGDERHGLGPRRPQAMEVEGQQFHQVVRPVHRAVDPGPRPLEHPPLAVAQVEDQELRLAPLDADLAAVLHALALGGLDLGADADPPAVDLGDDVLPGHLLARREPAVARTAAGRGSGSPGPRPPTGGTCGGPPSRRASAPGGGVRRGPVRSRGARRSGGPPGFAGRGWSPCGCPGRPARDRSRPPPGPGPWRCGPWGRSRSWRSRRPGRPGGGASAAASPGGVAIGRHRRAPLFLGLGPAHPGSSPRPGGWRSSGRRGGGSGRGSRPRGGRSWRGPGPVGRATAASWHRSVGSASR